MPLGTNVQDHSRSFPITANAVTCNVTKKPNRSRCPSGTKDMNAPNVPAYIQAGTWEQSRPRTLETVGLEAQERGRNTWQNRRRASAADEQPGKPAHGPNGKSPHT